MAFMQLDLTEEQLGWRVETSQGTFYVPGDVHPVREGLKVGDELQPFDPIAKGLNDYVEGEVMEAVVIHGYFGRMSAPGYLDCTDWNFHEEEDSLREILEEMYADDDAEEQT